ncbi:MAG: deoxyribose-phosphate aldolase [Bacilli bacterium]|nr:deoxyribose-phosphate aldolase [Bacilli bacterium]
MEFNKLFDHTLLKPEATTAQVKKICDEAKEFDFASVCVNPDYVAFVANELKGTTVNVCTVIGFPLGSNIPEVKAYEAEKAVEQGATEIDMVLNVSKVKEGDYDYVAKEIALVKAACHGKLLKVILETCLLTPEEIKKASEASEKGGADYVKTSTGFNKGGATVEAVRIMRETVGDRLGVKASGGIHTKAEACAMVEAGASRLGCSASVAIMNEK